MDTSQGSKDPLVVQAYQANNLVDLNRNSVADGTDIRSSAFVQYNGTNATPFGSNQSSILTTTQESSPFGFLAWSPGRSRDAYADPFELFADGLTLMREEAQELGRMGCPYIQIDAPDFGQLIDPEQQTVWAAAGIPFERVMTEGAEMLNEVASVPGVTFGLHICKGNYDSHWISAGGYESIASQLFPRLGNYDRILLEYENERSGSFEPLKELPDDKVVVLGLVSSKFDELESPEGLIARIDEAARFYPRDQLALSTQCGFASAGPGNAISEDAQERKLRLVAEVANRVWA